MTTAPNTPPPPPEPMPPCPHCGNNRQVWRNQLTDLLTCHRAWCDTVIPDPKPQPTEPLK